MLLECTAFYAATEGKVRGTSRRRSEEADPETLSLSIIHRRIEDPLNLKIIVNNYVKISET